ncbi:Myosin-IIIa-like [Homarus americanus]|uniref:Myosin-IIIa-like n=1 Tax=Homarus americanus TaxID=6706 RepID=A0A8J5N6G2_HOMAM|nr:Myosin-IIIa-like [Homarus americanus]
MMGGWGGRTGVSSQPTYPKEQVIRLILTKLIWCRDPVVTCGYLGLPGATWGYLGATCGYLRLPVATWGYLQKYPGGYQDHGEHRENLEEIEEEYLILRDLSLHPNLPAFHGIFFKKGVKQEETRPGSPWRRGQRLTEQQLAYILKETIDVGVPLPPSVVVCMHRDIKGHNILLTQHGNIKLVDFGVSSHLASTWGRRNTSVGTPYWMAPEVIACEQQLDYSYDVRCDVWSLGITAIELADGEPPLSEIHPMRALFQIPRNPPPTLERPVEWSFDFNDFISECLVKDFEQRAGAKELLQHPFIKAVPNNPEEMRLALTLLQDDLRKKNQLIQKEPETTIKGGALKADRKTKRVPLWMDDLACLEKLSEEVIVDHLGRRYETDQIYTYMGDILIAINPFREIGVYGDKESRLHRGMVKSENPPHIFAMADNAYHNMLHQKQQQCIVISGESGAGKTESANFLLKQLVTLGKAPNRNLEDKILQVNPIMESFGNAKTGINDNSSRFGKYLELTYTRLGKVTGAKISVYLLEQSRVVHQAEGEQNFHIFYYLHDGLEAEDKLLQYCLDKNKRDKHHYLSGANWSKSKSEANVAQFKKVVEGFKSLGFRDDELDSVYRILASIINLGDVDFYQTIDKDNMEQAAVKNVEQIKIVSELLGIDPADLTEALTSNSVVTKGEIITRNNTVEEAISTRDAMAKAIGESIAVGLLDIFGFENFEMNSFEQLCINIANEQIQYFFNQHIFTWEQQEYMSEGIEVNIIEFSDNRPVLDMFLAKPMGLLALLDEESRFPKATDQSLVEKFHDNIKSQYYMKPKAQGYDFTIRHFAGRVAYDTHRFLEKNKNFLPTEVIQLLRQSSHDIIRYLFQCPLTKTGNLYYATPKNSPRATLTKQKQAKSTSGSTSTQYDSRGLASQTKAQQTVATYFRYCFLAFNFDERVTASKENCRLLLLRLKMDGWALGKTKVFLKYYHVEYLTKIYEKQIRRIIQVQACVRMWLARIRFTRGWIIRKKYQEVCSKKTPEEARHPPAMKAPSPPPPDKRKLIHKDSGQWGKAKMIGALGAQSSIDQVASQDHTDDHKVKNASELTKEEAALIIQAYEAALVIQKFWGRHKKKKRTEAATNEELGRYTNSKRMTSLIMFSQNVHMSNQETHKFLRRHKAGVRLEEVTTPDKDYIRPRGFDHIPQVINEQRKRAAPQPPGSGNTRPLIKITSTDDSVSNYYDFLQEEMRRAAENAGVKVDLRKEKVKKVKEGLKTQNMVNEETEEMKLRQWKGAVAVGAGVSPPEWKGRPATSTTNMQAASELRQMLRSNGAVPPKRQAPRTPAPTPPKQDQPRTSNDAASQGSQGGAEVEVEDTGPYNFRQFLRKTNYAPTDTIRKRQLKRDGLNGYGAEYQM